MWARLDALAALVVITAFWVPPTLSAAIWPRVAAAVVLAAATAGAMLLRRRPVSIAVAAVCTIAGTALAVCVDPMLATAWCLYPLAVERAHRARGVVVLAAVAAGLAAVTGVEGGSGSSAGRTVVAVGALSITWMLGAALGRELAAARAAERARVQLGVARDVHDVVGHALGVISARAGVPRNLPDADEAELRSALADIETQARDGLRQVQGLVHDLRVLETGPVSPQRVPGVADVASLIDHARTAGLVVEADIDAGLDEPGVGDGLRLVVFRIVQESMGNVVRHAPGARCSVRVARSGAEVVVRVRDHGSSGSHAGAGVGPGAGSGLRGLRERAELTGGTVDWHRPPDGGFEVNARLPIARED